MRESVEERWIELPGRGPLWVRDQAGPTPDAPVVVLLHGLGVTARFNWGESYGVLARSFRVLALDHRGHGKGLRTARFSLEECADDALAVCEALGLDRVVLAGYSLGGPIALLGWRRHPARVAGLVLAATASRFGGTRRAQIARALLPLASLVARVDPERVRTLLEARARFRLAPALGETPTTASMATARVAVQRIATESGAGRRVAGARAAGEGIRGAVERVVADAALTDASWIAEELRGHHPASLVQAVRAAWRFAPESWLHEIDVPVAVLVTAQDDRVPPERQRELAREIPAARVFEVPGDHTACVTRADRFAPALHDALADAWSRARPDR